MPDMGCWGRGTPTTAAATSRHSPRWSPGAARWARVLLQVVAVAGPATAAAQAGNTPEAALVRALDLEAANKCREAISLYRQAVRVEDPTGAVLGLERCYSMIGRPDSILTLLDTLLIRKPSDPTLRTVQLRTLATVRRDAQLQVAFEQWVALAPRDAAPYRTYAQVLLDGGRARGADTVLQAAAAALGGTHDIAGEFAQMQAALGQWVASAQSWRDAGQTAAYLEQAAVFALMPAPAALRDSVRAVLSAPPLTLGSRRILSGLELKWHAPRDAWRVLAELPANDSTVEAWIAFARDAEGEESWLTARDAYARAFQARAGDHRLAVRAATAALNGGDPASALEVSRPLAAVSDSGLATTIVLLQVQALGALGRAPEAQQVLSARGGGLDPASARLAQRALAWAWIRSGDLVRANAALDVVGRDTEEGERVAAWIALYQGDLKAARRGLRRTDETSNDVVTAMALLSRTRADSSLAVGGAFLTLARGDTSAAAREFQQVAGAMTDAAPFLSGTAARLYLAARDTAEATRLWQVVLAQYPDAPEAAESELAWARVLRVRGDTAGAVAHLEHLILTYPQSALIPQARRELDLAKGAVPTGGESLLFSVGDWRPGGPPPLRI